MPLQAYAAFKFAEACMSAMHGRETIECAYVASSLTKLPFFASPVRLGPHGVQEVLPLPPMSAVEEQGFTTMLAELQASIDKGIAFASS